MHTLRLPALSLSNGLIVLALALLALVLTPRVAAQTVTPAVEARVEVSFVADPANGPQTEYVVEQKEGAEWKEVAKGPASPITYTLPAVRVGDLITARVRARLIAAPTKVTNPSNETSDRVGPRQPKEATMKASEPAPVAVTLLPGQSVLVAVAATDQQTPR